MDNLGFKEFINKDLPTYHFDEIEILNLYLQGQCTLREISKKTNCSIGEIYRVIHRHGAPNRTRKDQDAIVALIDSGMPTKTIADITGYTDRHIRNIAKKKT